MTDTQDLPALLREAGYITKRHYEALAEPMPADAVQRSDGAKTGKGYNTTGYGYQFIVDRLNEVLGPSHWRTMQHFAEREDGQTSKGRPWYRADCEMTLEVGLWIDGEWRVMATKDGEGWHRAMDSGDAKKGSRGNALKKIAAMYGVGADAYRGAIDDDNQPEAERAESSDSGSPAMPDGMHHALTKLAAGEAKILADVDLTDWERDFLPDFLEKFRKYGRKLYVSEKQDAALVKLWDKVVLHYKATKDAPQFNQGAARAAEEPKGKSTTPSGGGGRPADQGEDPEDDLPFVTSAGER